MPAKRSGQSPDLIENLLKGHACDLSIKSSCIQVLQKLSFIELNSDSTLLIFIHSLGGLLEQATSISHIEIKHCFQSYAILPVKPTFLNRQ